MCTSSPLVVVISKENIYFKQLNYFKTEKVWVCTAYNTIILEQSEDQNKCPSVLSEKDLLSRSEVDNNAITESQSIHIYHFKKCIQYWKSIPVQKQNQFLYNKTKFSFLQWDYLGCRSSMLQFQKELQPARIICWDTAVELCLCSNSRVNLTL